MNIPTGEFRAITNAAAEVGYDSGRDSFAYDLGTEIRTMIDGGATDTQIVDAAREMIAARMEVGLPSAGWFAT